MDKITENQSIIIALDVDALLFDKLQQIDKAGFSVVEINTSDKKTLTSAIKQFPALRIGAGNVTSIEQLESCYEAGVHFITSPGFLPAIAQTASVYSVHYLPGIATISEAMQALNFGCTHLRPFPADLAFCTLLNKYLPLLRLYPAELEWDEVEHFLNLPAVAAVSVINPEKKQLDALSAVSV